MVVFSVNQAADVWDLVRGKQLNDALITSKLRDSNAIFSSGPVLIFTAAADPDALAAVRTLTSLLKADLVRYEVHPVSGYAMLREKFDVLVRGEAAVEPRSILCVNCGAMVDIETILDLDGSNSDSPSTDVRVFVLDPHRPFHLANVSSKNVIAFDGEDGFKEGEMPINLSFEDEWGNLPDEHSSDEEGDESDFQSDFDSDDSENDDDLDAEEGRIQPNPSDSYASPEDEDSADASKEAHDQATDSASTEHNAEVNLQRGILEDDVVFDENRPGGSDDSDEDEGTIRKRNTKRKSTGILRKRRSQKKRRRARQHRSQPGNEIEMEERKRLRDYYSNAFISTSSAVISHAIADVLKRSSKETLWMAIIGTTSQTVASYTDDALYEKQLADLRSALRDLQVNDEDDPDTSRIQNVGYVPLCNSGAVQRIADATEYRLDLLRHWTLHDSLLHSSYTATRLGAWRQTGKRRLLEILATLGIPLKESKQKWCYMKQESKRAFDSNFEKAIKRFDLGHAFKYDTFVRTIPGHRGDISAADYVHAITALLEFDDPSQKDRRDGVSHSLINRFWRGYDALDSKKTCLLETGLEMAICAQRLTAEIGGDVVERRKYVPSGPFRYVFLRDQQLKEYLAHPLLLRRLALFLKSALLRQGLRDKPFIILAPDTIRGKWIAVAATTSGQKNDFGQRFMKAAERNRSEVTYAGFDASACEIPDGQEIEFVRFLHDVMR